MNVVVERGEGDNGMWRKATVRYGHGGVKLTHRSPSNCFKERGRKRREKWTGGAGLGVRSLGPTTRKAGWPTTATTSTTTTATADARL